jgi:hypothetical protein
MIITAVVAVTLLVAALVGVIVLVRLGISLEARETGLGILPGMSVERADPTAGGPAPGIADWGEDAGSARSEHDGRVAVGRYVGRTIEPQNRSPAAGDDLDHRMRSRLPREQA